MQLDIAILRIFTHKKRKITAAIRYVDKYSKKIIGYDLVNLSNNLHLWRKMGYCINGVLHYTER